MSVTIETATEDHLPAIVDIYNHYVINTTVTFDIRPYSVHQRTVWLNQFAPDTRHQLFVAVEDNEVLGYAGSMQFRQKAAYDPSIETTIYMHPEAGGRGIGSQLMDHLIAALKRQDVHRMYSGITLPNEPSLALHKRFGFHQVGIFTQVGRKFDAYHDVAWLEKSL